MLGLKDGLAASLVNQANILTIVGRPQEALPLAEEALDLAVKHDYRQLAEQVRRIRDHIRGLVQCPR